MEIKLNEYYKMKKILKQFIPPILIKFLEPLKVLFRDKSKSSIFVQGVEMVAPFGFPLEDYQKEYKTYDRLLPVLVKHIGPKGVLVDIGANIGDTLFSIVKKCKNEIICIEPSDIYYEYLETNYNKLVESESSRVKLVKKFIGTGSFTGKLIHEHGTAHIEVDNNDKVEFVELDKLFFDKDLKLIKVDTDGFDYDVLLSSKKIIQKQKPILFWENLIEHEFQMKGFDELYSFLSDNGYNNIYVFDNFGNIIVQSSSFDTLIDLNEYLYSQLKFNCHRTFHYTDILAATIQDKDVVESAIAEFKNEIIRR